MMVTAIVSIAAASILRSAQGNILLATLGTVSIGVAASGPWLLIMHRRAGTLVGRWGIGELAWFSLGANFLLMMVWNLLFVPEPAEASRWMIVAGVLCCATIWPPWPSGWPAWLPFR